MRYQTRVQRAKPSPQRRLTEDQVLKWADAHHRRTGEWPTAKTGPVIDVDHETWIRVDAALRKGLRGLPGESSLARLLAARRGVRNRKGLAPLSINLILKWADAHKARTGRWPRLDSGPVMDAPRETWSAIHSALYDGNRGFAGGATLAGLLVERRCIRARKHLPLLTESRIVTWAREHHRRTGRWPTYLAGAVFAAPSETWAGINAALMRGHRGLRGGSSLPVLLMQRCGHRNHMRLAAFTVPQILKWAEKHFQRTGKWPYRKSGAVVDAPDETWDRVCNALAQGHRGLPGGISLTELLVTRLGARSRAHQPRLSVREILRWARLHHRRTGVWPRADSGQVRDAEGEDWKRIDSALHDGSRGLPEGSSLTRLLVEQAGAFNEKYQSKYTIRKILLWARAHHRRTRRWPNRNSGPIPDAPGENWMKVDGALKSGNRGVPGGSSLARVLVDQIGVQSHMYLPKLTMEQIALWAKAHCRRTGEWPHRHSGRVTDAPREVWLRIDGALQRGYRGLPGESSLAKLVAGLRKPKAIVLAKRSAYRIT